MYYVYYDLGNCNDGSHDSGLSKFDTEEEARRFAQEVRSNTLLDGVATVIYGHEIILA